MSLAAVTRVIVARMPPLVVPAFTTPATPFIVMPPLTLLPGRSPPQFQATPSPRCDDNQSSSRCSSRSTSADVAIQGFKGDLGSAATNAHAREFVAAIDELSIPAFAGSRDPIGQRLRIEVREQPAVHGLHRELGSES